MGLLDGLLAQVTQSGDIASLASKVGISPEQAEAAIAALAQAHTAPTDTVSTAAENTGLPTDILQQIIGHIGGEGSLGAFANLVQSEAGQGVLGQLSGLAGGFFGKK
jgi:hypothetical protein